MTTVLDLFSPAARAWFSGAFPTPTEVQDGGWRSVAAGQHTLMSAPTGSGKTLAAFFWCIDRLATEPVPAEAERCRVLYVSPLKALTVDIERNLQAPLRGIGLQAERLGATLSPITVAIRTGDTPPRDRRPGQANGDHGRGPGRGYGGSRARDLHPGPPAERSGGADRPRARRPPPKYLAGDPSTDPGAGTPAPLDHHLCQLAATGGAAGRGNQ